MKREMTAAGAAIAGAGLMYLLDPQSGNRRRATLSNKVFHLAKVAGRGADITMRDVSHRTVGVFAEITARLRGDEISDDILEERVRSAIGRIVSHPGSVEVSAEDGRISLSGPVLDEEHKRLLKGVRNVRGVRSVEDELEPEKSRGREPGLQGGAEGVGRTGVMRRSWPPSTRAFGAIAGVGALVFGASRRNVPGALLAGAGATLLLRSITNMELPRLLGITGGRRGIDLQKTITIAAPVQRVYSAWTNYENFPFFMSRVREIRDLGDGRSHWVVSGPANANVEWDAVITKNVPNQIIAWKTEPGALVGHAGIVRFEPEGNATRVQIRLSYNPPAGAIGHSIAWLAGADPKKAFDEDLVRIKTFIETGIRPHDAGSRYVG